MDLLVDPFGVPLFSPPVPSASQAAAAVGMREVVPLPTRLVWAALARRYEPSHPPGEVCLFGMDFSFLLPMGVGIGFAQLNIFNNTFLSPDVSADWVIGPVTVSGRRVWTLLQGGVAGSDYELRFSITTTDGDIFPRSGLVLCSQTV